MNSNRKEKGTLNTSVTQKKGVVKAITWSGKHHDDMSRSVEAE